MPPPTQGVTALEALRIVDGLDLGADGPDREHLLIEAMKLALADRNAYLGDPDAMTIAPERLLADDWIARAGARASTPTRASTSAPRPGPDGGTIYMCTADRDGLLVSLIQSNFTGAGCRTARVDEWGINLHNRGSAFHLDAGAPERHRPAQDAVAHAHPRAGAPRRPARGSCSAARAATARRRRICSCSSRMLVDGDDPQAAITAPRFTIDPDDWSRRRSRTTSTPTWIDDLRGRGHEIDVVRGYRHGPGIAHAIECIDARLPRRLRPPRRGRPRPGR